MIKDIITIPKMFPDEVYRQVKAALECDVYALLVEGCFGYRSDIGEVVRKSKTRIISGCPHWTDDFGVIKSGKRFLPGYFPNSSATIEDVLDTLVNEEIRSKEYKIKEIEKELSDIKSGQLKNILSQEYHHLKKASRNALERLEDSLKTRKEIVRNETDGTSESNRAEYLGSFFKTSSSRNPITEDLGCIDFKLNENIESISLYFRYVDYVIDNLGGCVLSLEVYPEDKREDISKENNPSKENNLPNEKNTENTTSGKIYFRLKTFQYVPIKISCAHASATLNLGNVIMDCSIVDGQESMDKTKRCISNRFSLVQQFKEKDRHPEILEIYRSK